MRPRVGGSLNGLDRACLARQPILDRHGHVFGYELLYRASPAIERCDESPTEVCAPVMVDAVLSVGLETLAPGKRAFVNMSRELLLSGAASVLPREQVVIELLESVEADSEVIGACKELKASGYALALDDFTYSERVAPLVEYADYLKIDFLATATPAARADMLSAIGPSRPHLLAEKIETPEAFDQAVSEGFSYFQGYFFARPAIREVKRIASRRAAYATLLVELSKPDISVFELENVIKQDMSLSYRVLRALNAAATPLRVEISSIRQAIVLLGRDTIRQWALLWTMASINESAHPELVSSAIIRARCCETLDPRPELEGGNGFLLGMCSLLDAILEQPMEAVLAPLPIPADVRSALLGAFNDRRLLLDCVVAYERADWDRCDALAEQAGIDPTALPAAYHDALRWTRDFAAAHRTLA